jgi:hypothetical protein
MQTPVPTFAEPLPVPAATPLAAEPFAFQPAHVEPPADEPEAGYLTNYSPEPTHTAGIHRVEGADMAALMRELSSLNSLNDEELPAAVVSRPVAQAATPPRKKKNFFGK